MFKIEKGIEIPKKTFNDRNNYPFDKMEVGDSFFVPLKEGQKINSLQPSIATAARLYSVYHKKDWKFKTAKNENGVRVWRTH